MIRDSLDPNVIKFNSMLLSAFYEEDNQDDLVSRIIENIPEWKRLINCKQHNIHDFTLDVHTLLVLKNIKLHKDYEQLSEKDKLILVYSALLHDIEKNENQVDPQHPLKGAEKAGIILYRLGFDEDFINSVYLLVKYHQILGLIISRKINLSDDELYNMFKKDIIIDLQVILSAADIKSVKRDGAFYSNGLDEKFDELKKKIKNIIAEKNKLFDV